MNIKEARERAGLTIAEAAEKIGTTGGVVKDWEKGKAPLPGTFKKLCKAYGVSPKEVIVEGRNDQLPLTLPGARYNAGLSAEKAATEMGLSYGTVQSMERGLAIITEEQKVKFCELYGVTADEIVWPRDKAPEKQSVYASEPVPTAQLERNTGVPEHLPEDQRIAEMQKLQDENKALRERLAFYEDSEAGEIIGLRNLIEQYEKRIAGYEEAAAVNEDRIRAQHENLEQYRERMLKKQKIIDELINNRLLLETRITKLKAKAYDLMEEKAGLLERLFGPYQEKEDIE